MRFQRKFRQLSWIEQEAYSRRSAVDYVNYIASVSSTYSKRLKNAGISLPIQYDDRESWLKIPTIRKADFQADPEAWVNQSIDRSDLSWSNTSGSSGEPFFFPETADSCLAEDVSIELTRREIGWRPGQPEGLIKISPPKIAGFRRFAKKLTGTLPITFSAIQYRTEDTPKIVTAFNAAGVRYLRSFPTVLLLLAEDMLRRGLRCNIPRIMVFGEGLSPARASIIEEAFNARVYRDYGGSEAMHVGFQCARCPNYRLDLSRFHVEILDGDTPVPYGTEGEIVVTCFRNKSFPFVRYRMGDISAMLNPKDNCECGGGVWRLGEIKGRVIDVIYAPNGERLDAAFLVVVMEYTNNDVLAYKFVQRAPDLIELLFVPRHENARDNLREVEQKIIAQVRGAIQLKLTEVSELPSEPSGKRKILVPLKQEWKTSIE